MEHSDKYDRVQRYYVSGLWSLSMVHDAVGKWITAAEYQEITGEQYAN